MIQNMVFVSGINTLVQVSVGTRLPLAIGGSHAFVIPATTMALATMYSLPVVDPFESPEKRIERAMAGIQGGLFVASAVQIILGFSGFWRLFVRLLSPLSMVPLITFSGLGLFYLGFPMMAECVELGLPQLTLILISSQYLPRLMKSEKPIYDRYALIFSTAIAWTLALVLTSTGVFNHKPPTTQLSCRTDHAGLIHASRRWIELPRPLPWGKPSVRPGQASLMVFAGLVALIESTGTFIAAARYAGATPVPPSVVGRGAFWLGVGTLLNALFGAVVGPTASAESAGLLGLTRVGSRRAIYISAFWLILFSVVGPLGAFFASIPSSIVAASYCVLYAYVASAGLNHLQFCNLNSFRTLFILGFSFFMAISVPQYFRDNQLTSNCGPIHAHPKWFNEVLRLVLMSSPVVAVVVAVFLDNIIDREEEAARKDSGKHWWERFIKFTKDIRNAEFYSLPCRLGNCFPSL